LTNKFVKFAATGVLAASLISSPWTLNLEKLTTKAETETYAQPLETVSFISSTDHADTIDYIKKGKKDDSLGKLREKADKKALKINTVKLNGKLDKKSPELVASTDVALDAKDVRKNTDLQNYAHEALQDGKRVYLFGDGLTAKEFKKLAKLDEIKVPVNVDGTNGFLEYGNDEDQIAEEKGELKPSAETTTEEQSNIIGYTLDKNQELQYFEINVTSYDEKGKVRPNHQEVYIQEILNREAELVEKKEKKVKAKKETALISTNKASASNNQVRYSPGHYGTVYDPADRLLGRVDYDYYLYKQSSDGDSTYDYFTIKMVQQLTQYNDGHARGIYTNIDVPFDSDSMQKWTPSGDVSRVSWEASLSYPFTIGYTITLKDTAALDTQGSLAYDYARWMLTDGSLNGDVWKPSAGWASKGTDAIVDLTGQGTFWFGPSDQYPAKATKKMRMEYNY
jgi:hypothetical protein